MSRILQIFVRWLGGSVNRAYGTEKYIKIYRNSLANEICTEKY